MVRDFNRYNRNFGNNQILSGFQQSKYAVAVLDAKQNVVGYAPPYDKANGFAIVDKDKAMIYPRSSNAYTRTKGMHVAKAQIQQKIVAEMQNAQIALDTEQNKSKPNAKLLKKLATTLNDIQCDLYEVNGYQFRIEKVD